MTAWGSVDLAVEAMRRGARDFVQKPWENARRARDPAHAGRARRSALRRQQRLEAENRSLKPDARPLLIADAPSMRPVLEIIQRVGPSEANVLITGENGTGKGHRRAGDPRRVAAGRGKGLVTVNAGGLSEGVFESELFGHVKGAFTDAKADRVGRFELADGGTLFLDEIANVPLNLQPKLLRVLETGEFERVGSSRTRRANVRILSATNASIVGRSRRRTVPAGSALPAEHDRDPASAASRAPRGHPGAGRALSAAARAALPQGDRRLRSGRPAGAHWSIPGPATSASSTTPSSAAS